MTPHLTFSPLHTGAQELAGRSAADHSMRSAEEESLSEGELPRSPTVGQPRSQGMGGWGSQRGDKWRAEQRQEQRQTDKWLHDKWDRDEPTRRGAAAPAGEVQPASPSGKRRLRGRGRRRSGRGLEMDRVRPTAGSVQPSGGSEQRPLPPPAAEQPGEALGQHWQSPEERLAAEVAAEWRIKAQSPLWHREMEGDAPRGSGNEAVLLAAVAALEQAAPGGVHTALRFEERLSQLDRWVHCWAGHFSAVAAVDPSAMHASAAAAAAATVAAAAALFSCEAVPTLSVPFRRVPSTIDFPLC